MIVKIKIELRYSDFFKKDIAMYFKEDGTLLLSENRLSNADLKKSNGRKKSKIL